MEQYLDFEKPIVDLEEKLMEMQKLAAESSVDLSSATNELEDKLLQLKKEIYGKLTRWQKVQISRKSDRPYT